MIYKLKSKQRIGSIFIDKVKRIIAAIERENGTYDYLVEWELHKKDKLKPETSIVKGSHLVFTKPLLYRRFVEKAYMGGQKSMDPAGYSQPIICQSPDKNKKAEHHVHQSSAHNPLLSSQTTQ